MARFAFLRKTDSHGNRWKLNARGGGRKLPAAVSAITHCLSRHTKPVLIKPCKSNFINSIAVGCCGALSPGARQQEGQENQHAAASCDLKQKIEIHRGFRG